MAKSPEAVSGRNKEELERLRKQANDIDEPDSPYKAIVSVLVLKEGWDVRNVTTIVGLRAFSAKSNILPEQTLGRGLRKMYSGETEEKVSVVGTDAFMEFVESIQAEGVQLERAAMGEGTQPKTPLVVEVDSEKEAADIAALDIEIPVLTPHVYRNMRISPGWMSSAWRISACPISSSARKSGAKSSSRTSQQGKRRIPRSRSRRRGRLPQCHRVFCSNRHEGNAAVQCIRRAVRQDQGVRADGRCLIGRWSLRNPTRCAICRRHRDQKTDRDLQKGDQ